MPFQALPQNFRGLLWLDPSTSIQIPHPSTSIQKITCKMRRSIQIHPDPSRSIQIHPDPSRKMSEVFKPFSFLPGDAVRLVAEFHGVACTGVFVMDPYQPENTPTQWTQVDEAPWFERAFKVRVWFDPTFFFLVQRHKLVPGGDHWFRRVATPVLAQKCLEVKMQMLTEGSVAMSSNDPAAPAPRPYDDGFPRYLTFL